MISIINFIEVENRVVRATYRNLMIKAKVVIVDRTSGAPLEDPVTTISSPVPVGSLRIRLTDAVRPGTYFLMALNGHGSYLAKSADFEVP
ncbi:hypothetical protein ACQR1I_22515 [Bradyrhizobium sp. HKCCYLS2038]|uniref:hypothetical protein n=1 Tax=unclassified Bradyrhizobium TaxID=2631580 RepID=UPI003EB70A5F